MSTRSPLSQCDDLGAVYLSAEAVYRAIDDSQQEYVRRLIESGLIRELVDNGVFPETREADIHIKGYQLVLEHEKIDPITYPFEWSPEMLRRAGLCVLKVNRIANKYGYELKDAHPYNVVFRNSSPVFVDFGSLVKKSETYEWIAYIRFMSAYVYPLRLYGMGLNTVFKNLFYVSGRGVPAEEYAVLRHPWLRKLGQSFLRRACRGWLALRNTRVVARDRLHAMFRFRGLGRLAEYFFNSRIFRVRLVSHQSLERKLTVIKWSAETEWGTYHARTGCYSDDGEIRMSERMQAVLECVRGMNARRVLELAGNQGVLSREIVRRSYAESVICTDYDENAIDRMVTKTGPDEFVTPVVLDFMRAPIQGRGIAVSKRLRSDVVVALAVTHHLILTQGYSLEAIINTIASYTSRYLVIEFMPLGLFSNRSGYAQPIPEWYTPEWFEEGLRKRFKVLKSERLERNRILYAGEIIGNIEC